MKPVVIKAEGISKSYNLSRSLLSGVQHELGAVDPRILQKAYGSGDKITALSDISFEVRQGEVIGVIGRNGAGKTTLLKTLAGITKPTSGYAEISGQMAAILEIGMGFHSDLTGMENIFFNGKLMGMSKNDIRRQIDNIIDFSGVSEFINVPVKYYSKGMYARLAFAVVAHLSADIILLDEVFLFGDVDFKKASFQRINQLISEGRTLMIVTHNLNELVSVCSRVFILRNGEIIADGHPEQIIPQYVEEVFSSIHKKNKNIRGFHDRLKEWETSDSPGNDTVRVRRLSVKRSEGDHDGTITNSDAIDICFTFEKLLPVSNYDFGFLLKDSGDNPVFGSTTMQCDKSVMENSTGVFTATGTIPGNLLNSGTFFLHFLIIEKSLNQVNLLPEGLFFKVELNDSLSKEIASSRFIGPLRPGLQWKISNEK
ncbi:MAG: ABC transporter ATP-binding protein [Bacteroidetes bacterium]|nr:ABC transporter ATP-binding protein [Bacteroidota bacterium]MBU1718277.1 ABC transporter ATP-binding protein [Bacteroidota bacterium]